MRTDWNENQATLIGEAVSEPVFSHASHGEDFFRVPVKSLRLSGAEDVINVILSRTLLESCPLRAGERAAICGEVRSYNNRGGVGSRLVITLYAQELYYDTIGADDNRLTLAGVICKPPVYRLTPLGREITDLILAVNRRYGRADYLPCIAWGSLAVKCGAISTGDGLRLEGRLQSRGYTKIVDGGEVKRTAYEVSIMTMEAVAYPQASAPEEIEDL
ncbi:MAG: single-stranded DNA-binding protein [Clostridiales bacterium]|nr:single-stranded DNA-binding protein [Clostridiales bacterium]